MFNVRILRLRCVWILQLRVDDSVLVVTVNVRWWTVIHAVASRRRRASGNVGVYDIVVDTVGVNISRRFFYVTGILCLRLPAAVSHTSYTADGHYVVGLYFDAARSAQRNQLTNTPRRSSCFFINIYHHTSRIPNNPNFIKRHRSNLDTGPILRNFSGCTISKVHAWCNALTLSKVTS